MKWLFCYFFVHLQAINIWHYFAMFVADFICIISTILQFLTTFIHYIYYLHNIVVIVCIRGMSKSYNIVIMVM